MDTKKMAEQPEVAKYQTPRGPAATAAKNKYRDSNYDRAELALPKGMKEKVKQLAKRKGQSFNEYVCEAVKDRAERDTEGKIEWGKQKERG